MEIKKSQSVVLSQEGPITKIFCRSVLWFHKFCIAKLLTSILFCDGRLFHVPINFVSLSFVMSRYDKKLDYLEEGFEDIIALHLTVDVFWRNVRYLPPERLLGSKNNVKSDVWSLGVMITELVFSCILWQTSNIAQVRLRLSWMRYLSQPHLEPFTDHA